MLSKARIEIEILSMNNRKIIFQNSLLIWGWASIRRHFTISISTLTLHRIEYHSTSVSQPSQWSTRMARPDDTGDLWQVGLHTRPQGVHHSTKAIQHYGGVIRSLLLPGFFLGLGDIQQENTIDAYRCYAFQYMQRLETFEEVLSSFAKAGLHLLAAWGLGMQPNNLLQEMACLLMRCRRVWSCRASYCSSERLNLSIPPWLIWISDPRTVQCVSSPSKPKWPKWNKIATINHLELTPLRRPFPLWWNHGEVMIVGLKSSILARHPGFNQDTAGQTPSLLPDAPSGFVWKCGTPKSSSAMLKYNFGGISTMHTPSSDPHIALFVALGCGSKCKVSGATPPTWGGTLSALKTAQPSTITIRPIQLQQNWQKWDPSHKSNWEFEILQAYGSIPAGLWIEACGFNAMWLWLWK